jgi:hypothetical protein
MKIDLIRLKKPKTKQAIDKKNRLEFFSAGRLERFFFAPEKLEVGVFFFSST